MIVPRVFLNSKEEREIEQGFPWVYDNEIAFMKYEPEDESGIQSVPLADWPGKEGSLVEVYAKGGAFLGTGVINRASKITVRIFSNQHADVISEDLQSFWAKRVRDAVNIRRLNYTDTDSYRLIFGEADLIPGLIVEQYVSSGKVYLVVQFLALACEVFREYILSALKTSCAPYGIYERSDASVREKEGLEGKTGWIGAGREEKIIIEENGVQLEVDIAHGQKTGYFLDQKWNRRAIWKLCHGKRVLDAFSHTGAFGLNAVSGGAREVISVDISEDAVSMIQRNIQLNHAEKKMSALTADVFDLLKQYETEGQKFDVIILDPPAFTKSAKQVQKAYGGYKEINLRAMRLLNEGGMLVTCSCSHFFDANMFYSMIMHAARDSHRRIQVLEKRGAGADHPVLLGYPKSEYLKCAICRVL